MNEQKPKKSHARQCGAKCRNGQTCHNTAIMANGRCRMHGGAAGRPISCGLYSAVARGKLKERLEAAADVQQPFDLQGELALLRGLLQDTLDRWDGSEYRTRLEAVLEEHWPELADRALIAQEIAQLLPEREPAYMAAVLHLTNSIRRVVATIAKIRNDTALTIAEVRFLQAGLETLIGEFLPDPNSRGAFVARLARLVPRAPEAQQ